MTKIFVIAGEESGDLIGGDLLQQIKQAYPDCMIAGIGGERMQRAGGFQSVFPLSDLSVMGLFEVIKHLPRLLKRIKQAKDSIRDFGPDVLLTIDAPDFSLRIAKWAKQYIPQMKTIHTVAPTVWAWRAGRAKKIAQFLDGLLCLFPFEPPYFTAHGLKAEFIGHPLTQIIQPADEQEKQNFYARYHLEADQPILCLLPGSRTREIEALLPVFLDTATRLKQDNPQLQIILPTLPCLQALIESHAKNHSVPVIIIPAQADKYLAMQCSTVALHASGTVALELALCDVPMVTAYKMSPVSIWIARKLLNIKDVNLVNLLAGQRVVPEYIQEDCTVDNLTHAVDMLLNDQNSAQIQRETLQQIKKRLQVDKPAVDFIKQYF